MKSAPIKINRQAQMRVVNNKKSTSKKSNVKKQLGKININTIMPKFSYSNSVGEIITTNNCAML